MRAVIRRVSRAGLLAVGVTLLTASAAAALDDPIELTVDTWTSDAGRAYVGVRAAGQWAIPAEPEATEVTCDQYYGRWELMGVAQPAFRHYWVWLYRCADDERVNVDAPVNVAIDGGRPAIGISAEAYGDLSLYLSVAVEPASAPAGTERIVRGRLAGEWADALTGYLAAHVDRASLRVTGWTVDFGDGTVEQHPPDPDDPEALAVAHTHEEAGEFEAIVTAHVAGEAYGAFFAPGGVPAERVEPFALDISNSAGGGAVAVEYTAPVVTVGASPSSPMGPTPVDPVDDGSVALWWPRGLLCELHPRAIVVSEGLMTSGGVVLGTGTTRLVNYRYTAAINDASAPTPSGTYAAGQPIRIQWDTPLAGGASYPVGLELELETTYPDGTVRTTTAAGTVEVTVVYSAVGGS